MRAVLFDLDDTLYPEMQFVESGFRAVAGHWGQVLNLGVGRDAKIQDLTPRLFEALRGNGRGRVFDTVLRELGEYSEQRVRTALFVYRSHRPSGLRLYEDAQPTLRALRELGFRLGLVTDGIGTVQRNKIQALELDDHFDAIVCSDEIGSDCWKPAGAPYEVALDLLGATPREAAYVGNDARKDFLWPNAAGMLTIDVSLDRAAATAVAEPARASVVVSGLGEVVPVVERSLHAR